MSFSRPLALFLLLPSCLASTPASRGDVTTKAARHGALSVVSAFDLAGSDTRSRELSAITWDARARTLWAISDHDPWIVPLVPAPDWRSWTVGEPVAVRTPSAWDGEGIAFAGERLFIANEAGPHLYEISRGGEVLLDVPLPEHFAASLPNRSFESLTASPDGRYLFVANESALTCDGAQPDATAGTVVRVLRIELGSGQRVEHAYRTDAIFAAGTGGDMGVADLVALSESELLVLERSFVPGVGNAIRIYHAAFEGQNVVDVGNLGARSEVMRKELLTTFDDLAGSSVVPRLAGGPRFPNYEGIALGPTLPDGARILFVISDDNARAEQVTRILVLRLADKADAG